MGEKEFQVSTAYSGYVFLGWAKGQFEPEKGRKMPYYNANQGLKAREGGRKTAQKSRECKYVANKSHNTLLRCLRQ